jgi:hypothetical protein
VHHIGLNLPLYITLRLLDGSHAGECMDIGLAILLHGLPDEIPFVESRAVFWTPSPLHPTDPILETTFGTLGLHGFTSFQVP